MFDADFSFSAHVCSLCKGCFCQLRDFRHIRHYLTDECAKLVAYALVSSRIHYSNSLFRSQSQICKSCNAFKTLLPELLQIALNFLELPQYWKKLHWLLIHCRSIFKTATLVYKYLHTGNPKYFSSCLRVRDCTYNKRHRQPGRLYFYRWV